MKVTLRSCALLFVQGNKKIVFALVLRDARLESPARSNIALKKITPHSSAHRVSECVEMEKVDAFRM